MASAGKNIADAVNSTRRVNAEIEQLKKIKEYRRLMSAKEKEPIITYTPTTRTETSKRLKPAVSNTRLLSSRSRHAFKSGTTKRN